MRTSSSSRYSPLIRAMSMVSVLTSIVLLSGCTYFSKTAQDKAACDKFSDVITSYAGSSAIGADALLYSLGAENSFSNFADQIDSEVKPLASMDFAPRIEKLVNYLRKASSDSVFDKLASYSYGIDSFAEVSGHCVLVSREN